jgi:hypothetical protein
MGRFLGRRTQRRQKLFPPLGFRYGVMNKQLGTFTVRYAKKAWLGAVLLLLCAVGWRLTKPAREAAAINWIVNNLMVLEGAKDQWGLEHHKTNGDRPTWNDLASYLKGGTIRPQRGESYYSNGIGSKASARPNAPLGSYQAGSAITVP